MVIDPKKLQPMPGYVLLEPTKIEEKTSGGIYLSLSGTEKQPTGKVVAVGADWVTESGATIKCPVKVGDTVLVKKWGGDEFKLSITSKEEYQIVKFDGILATLK
jgi:chaperonin GroES